MRTAVLLLLVALVCGHCASVPPQFRSSRFAGLSESVLASLKPVQIFPSVSLNFGLRAALQSGSTPPVSCLTSIAGAAKLANECKLPDGVIENGWATEAAKTAWCTTNGCSTILKNVVDCWINSGTAPQPVYTIRAFDLCPATGLKAQFVLPKACASQFTGCDVNFITAIQNAMDTKKFTALGDSLKPFCDADCPSKIPAVMDCLVTEKVLPSFSSSGRDLLTTTTKFFCAKNKAGQYCYPPLISYQSQGCVDPPSFDNNLQAMKDWMKNGQDAYCTKGCSQLFSAGLLCLAEAAVTVPGQSGPVQIAAAQAGYMDLLCIKSRDQYCLGKTEALANLGNKKLSDFTTDILKTVCDECTRIVIDRLILAGAKGLADNASVLKVLCLSEIESGDFCVPKLPSELKNAIDKQTSLENINSLPSKATLDAVCDSRCARRFLLALMNADIIISRRQNLDPSIIAKKYAARVAVAKTLQIMCFKNKSNDYCVRLDTDKADQLKTLITACPSLAVLGTIHSRYLALPPGDGPLGRPKPPQTPAPSIFSQPGASDIQTTPTGSCSSTCAAAMKTYADSIGCCFGLGIDAQAIALAADPSIPAEYVQPFVTEFAKVLALCGVNPETNPDYQSCAKPKGTKVATATITTSASPDIVNSVGSAISASVASDVCGQLVPPDSLVSNCKVTKVEATTIPAAGASGSRMFALDGSNMSPKGTTFTINFQGTDDASTAKFQNDFDRALSQNALAMDNTNMQYQSASGSSLSSVSYVAPSVEPTPDADDSASSQLSCSLLALVAAIALALLF